MIVKNIADIETLLPTFRNYGCIIIICKYNGGKSSLITESIHRFFGEKDTYYITFVDQSKPSFIPRKTRLRFNEITQNQVIIFDEIDADEKMDVRAYLKELIKHNLVIILTNPYGSSNNPEKEINLFQKHEKNILPEKTWSLFVESGG